VRPGDPGAAGPIVGLDHVQVAIPAGGEEAARRFYGDLLGLAEVTKPAPLAARGGCWFVGAGVALHLGAEADFRPARRAHLALLADDLDGLRRSLDVAGVTTRDDDAPIGVRRFYAFDPFGNRLELVDRRDGGFTDRTERPGT
jgi:catechol 2,3-dioxygenase-like lactoylglutathione lyase family enzyme